MESNNLFQNQQDLITYLPFHSPGFWDDFYKKRTSGEPLNWYFDLTKTDITDFSLKNITKDSEILLIGPGLSNTLDYFYENNYESVTVLDFSQELVNILKEKYKDNWDIICSDVCDLDSNYSELFNVILDKGCLDCILSDPKNGEEKFVNALNNLITSLVDQGTFYYFSDGKIEDRINLLFKIPGIRYRVVTIDLNTTMKEEYKEFNASDNIFYLYIITKS